MHSSPFRPAQDEAGASFLAYGSADEAVELVESFGEYEAEYAAIRKGVGILDLPHLGVASVAGQDRLDFLHRLLTNDTRSLQPGQMRRAFLLSKTGRIECDLLVLALEDRVLLVGDVFQVRRLPQILDQYLFSEDVQVEDQADRWSLLALHGPAAPSLLEEAGAPDATGLSDMAAQAAAIAGVPIRVARFDQTGTIGLYLLIPSHDAMLVYALLTQMVGGLVPDVDQSREGLPGPKRPIVGRGIGWMAYNTARIEAGSPLFHVDFGADCLPHETGVLSQAVSFTKGCYVGQEIVARMQNLGHPKRTIVGLRMEDIRLPIAGSEVFASVDGGSGDVVGAITSSAVSPMLGHMAIALAMVKWGKHRAGTKLRVAAEGAVVEATVQALPFIPRDAR